jgi:RNA polymerase Rpb8
VSVLVGWAFFFAVVCVLMNGCCSKVFVSFGGLLLFIQGPYKKLTPLRVDHVYLLIKK